MYLHLHLNARQHHRCVCVLGCMCTHTHTRTLQRLEMWRELMCPQSRQLARSNTHILLLLSAHQIPPTGSKEHVSISWSPLRTAERVWPIRQDVDSRFLRQNHEWIRNEERHRWRESSRSLRPAGWLHHVEEEDSPEAQCVKDERHSGKLYENWNPYNRRVYVRREWTYPDLTWSILTMVDWMKTSHIIEYGIYFTLCVLYYSMSHSVACSCCFDLIHTLFHSITVQITTW